MQRINNIKLKLTEDERNLKNIVLRKANIKEKDLKYFSIVKKSVDARDKNDINFVYTVDVSDKSEIPESKPIKVSKNAKILIVGAGPAGLFCALNLVRAGLKPIVIERGESVENRSKTVDGFFKTGKLNTESNIQFGEGGAGTFSDGKLNTGVSSPLINEVLDDFVKYGAPEDIKYLAKPHIGSDRLPETVKNIRNEIIRLGGKICFNTKLKDIKLSEGKIVGITADSYETVDDLVLAVGHSARDTFEMLYGKGVAMEQKPFAVGFRIEHPQREIDFTQYGKSAGNPKLPPADYRLASHLSERGVFTFCMCPGGYVMPAASEENAVVTNGMSLYKRDGVNANSAVLCEVRPSDFGGETPLAGVEFQRRLEKSAYLAGGGEYRAPVQLLGDYIKNRTSEKFGAVIPTYARGCSFYDLNKLLTEDMNAAIKKGVADFDRRLKGFMKYDAVLTGIESRSSSPLRILRTDNLCGVNVTNLYPCGEGCGYAGGIMSAAVDGIRVALKIIEKYL